MALEAKALLRRTLVGACAFAACLPLLVAAAVTTGGTDTSLPFLLALLVSGLVVAAVVSRRGRLAAAVGAVAPFVVLVSPLFDSTRVDSEAEVGAAPFGFPFRYVTAELTYSPQVFPQTFNWNPWEHPAELDLRLFVASYAVVLAATGAAALVARRLLRSRTSRALPRAG